MVKRSKCFFACPIMAPFNIYMYISVVHVFSSSANLIDIILINNLYVKKEIVFPDLIFSFFMYLSFEGMLEL